MSIHYLQEPICSIPPTNSFDAEEAGLIAMSRMQRQVWHDRWAHILIDAGETGLAVQMAEEARRGL
jgi:hypothetical protein